MYTKIQTKQNFTTRTNSIFRVYVNFNRHKRRSFADQLSSINNKLGKINDDDVLLHL